MSIGHEANSVPAILSPAGFGPKARYGNMLPAKQSENKLYPALSVVLGRDKTLNPVSLEGTE